jgi:tetratricopeptide (TPR) repeat protein
VSSEGDVEVAAALTDAEAALASGQPEAARERLDRVAGHGMSDAMMARFIDALQRANRLINRHGETVAWIEGRLGAAVSPGVRVLLLRSRVVALRQIDPQAALDKVEEALDAARALGDETSTAALLAHGSFCAYRRGDARLARQYADQAAIEAFTAPLARVEALRAQMFAATAAGAHERELELSTTVRDRLLELGEIASASNEYNNCAESYLRLGRADDAWKMAKEAGLLAAKAGHRGVESFAFVLAARAAAERGDLDASITALQRSDRADNNVMFQIDTLSALAYWLLERDDEGDAASAEEICGRALADAKARGVHHLVTTFHAIRARALVRLGDEPAARAELAQARLAADVADKDSELQLALTMAEVLAPGEPAREVSLSAARTRVLLGASKRDDPWRYCTGVRLHRRVLELSGGVPNDLPRGPG